MVVMNIFAMLKYALKIFQHIKLEKYTNLSNILKLFQNFSRIIVASFHMFFFL